MTTVVHKRGCFLIVENNGGFFSIVVHNRLFFIIDGHRNRFSTTVRHTVGSFIIDSTVEESLLLTATIEILHYVWHNRGFCAIGEHNRGFFTIVSFVLTATRTSSLILWGTIKVLYYCQAQRGHTRTLCKKKCICCVKMNIARLLEPENLDPGRGTRRNVDKRDKTR